ncbi:nuclease SbcCD subunit C [Rhodococcoides trifolii]|uniref:Nuclease SbcCD subunit C n=1 Tax=Rhodococcoides trifolii TaxID=908250 RepID=A0A917FZF6_9NOCA|nr:nuclease SbcCD subunit C [Rhodococcus trifolii]
MTVTAFGPFGGTVSVDFDELGADGLFLLHGHTGAGKTSILDAVAFALYGVVPGARRDTKRLLSDHAAPGVVPSVQLDATLGGRRLRLTRSPEYARPKLRGEGTTKQNAKATLTWLDGIGQNLTRIDEIALEVERLLGMRVDQFFQVVLLPQGDFARFLRAKNDERGQLLERLFDTDRFSDMESWFADRRRESAEALAGKTQNADRIAAKVAQAAGVEQCSDPEVLPWATALLETARDRAVTCAITLESARADHAAASESVRAARTVAEARSRGLAARQRLSALDSTADARTVDRLELERAQSAAPVQRRRLELDEAVRRSADAAAVVASRTVVAQGTVAADVAGGLSWPPSPTDADAVDAAVQRWSGESAVLDGVAADEVAREQLTTELSKCTVAVESVERDVAALVEQERALPAETAALDAEYTACVHARASVESVRTRHAAAVDAVTAAIEHKRAVAAAGEATARHSAAITRHQDLRQLWQDLREQRLDGMAAELARQLRTGRPCEVCGSLVHPSPATAGDDSVTRDDEEQARHAMNLAEQRRDEARAEVESMQREIDALAARGGTRLTAELTEALDTASAELRTTTALADRLPGVESARGAQETKAESLRASIAARTADAEQLRATIDTLRARIADAAARIDAALGSAGSARARRRELDAGIAALVSLRDARIDALAAERAAADLETRVRQDASDAQFDDVEAALAAVRDQQRIAVLTRRLADADAERVAATAIVADADVTAALAAEAVDAGPLTAAEDSARQVVEDALTDKKLADDRRVQLEDLVTQLWAVAQRLEPLRAAHAELHELAEVVSGKGQNSRKMSLRSYVLAARLEEVAVAASVRFRRMTGGRYEFVHSDDVGPRGTRGGLGLEIRDEYTGVVRAAGTLSGGEAFCASLALALGLADVVAAEAGGITLDTMFIDEGFGSLDSESLDSVMGVLDELRSGGRTVGIVSHVDEIRDRVPSRLHVIRERHGSTVRMHAGV